MSNTIKILISLPVAMDLRLCKESEEQYRSKSKHIQYLINSAWGMRK